MNKFIGGVVFSLLTVLISGCNETQPVNTPIEATQESQKAPSQIWIQAYLYGSNKPQPELIESSEDKRQVEQIYKWINEGEKDQQITASNIDRVYLLRFEFMKDGKIAESQNYLYAITTDSKLYAKQVAVNEKYNFDKYDSSKLSTLINEAGIEGWQELKSGVINNEVLPN
ncbi:hypothetical protein GPJ61_21685 [Brevibacillus formosus]|uniref:hypothetical protein n=1 Tax=Brevibacillus formosus TaxID=54913 RepID=UPI001CA4C775|nr:hypothetical protein [Brevibacillus formosus]MBW5470442.1 hypothetical protein [Brevibacillus formosus]